MRGMVVRTIVYIDGFNLYFGLREKNWRRYYWLDLETLAQSFLKPGQSLESVKYFTAKISDPISKARRQVSYIEALQAATGVEIFFGRYQRKPRRCRKCGHEHTEHSEKMTDVNIATEMMLDAAHDRFDLAILVSGDADLTPPVRAIQSVYPQKKVLVAFPPKRHSKDLRDAATATFTIGREKFARSQLPYAVRTEQGFRLTRPEDWR